MRWRTFSQKCLNVQIAPECPPYNSSQSRLSLSTFTPAASFHPTNQPHLTRSYHPSPGQLASSSVTGTQRFAIAIPILQDGSSTTEVRSQTCNDLGYLGSTDNPQIQRSRSHRHHPSSGLRSQGRRDRLLLRSALECRVFYWGEMQAVQR